MFNMKKIFLFFAAVSVLFACDATHEDISNGGHITADQLRASTSVTVDKASNGKNGNVITCLTTAPVNAKWTLGGKDLLGNYAKKKMKVDRDENGNYKDTEHKVYLTALCADGTLLKDSFVVNCQDITDPLEKYYIYGENEFKNIHYNLGADLMAGWGKRKWWIGLRYSPRFIVKDSFNYTEEYAPQLPVKNQAGSLDHQIALVFRLALTIK